jgi:hypothetical protein
MSELSEGTLREHDQRLEVAILTEVVGLHPERLTRDELTLRMADGPGEADRVAVADRLQELKRDGLIRVNGEVVEPTRAALRAAVVFGL